MSAASASVGPRTVDTPEELQQVMQSDFPPSPEQWEAIRAPLEPAVVVAGAGSGKTTLMAARVVYLVVTGQVRPDEVLGLTFTTKAASELRQRIREALERAGFGPGGPDLRDCPDRAARGEQDEEAVELLEPTVSTYNAYASALLSEHGLRIGHEPDTRVMADASRYQLAARVIDRHTGRVELLSDSPRHVIDYVLRLEGALSEHLVDVAALRGFDAAQAPRFAEALQAGPKKTRDDVASAFARRAEALDLVEEYRRLKQALGLMDFSDQIALAARLAESHAEVGEQERGKFKVVLLDEYQDTSVAQARMLRRLFGGGHPVMAVGDPNQAIYGWRGASVSNILRFGEDFPRGDGAEVARFRLSVNRRSDTRILDVANALADPLYRQFPMVAPLRSGTSAQGVVDVAVHETYAEELGWLAEQVRAAHDAGTPWREVGVLVRDNAHAADVFDALSAAEVPVEIVGLSGLLRLPEVAEVLATLTLLEDLTANADLLTLLTGPRWAVGPRDLALLGQRAEELAGARRGRAGAGDRALGEELEQAVSGADPTEVPALCDALDDPGELAYSAAARERFALLAAELRMLRAHVGEPLLELVRRIIETCGIDLELAASVSEAARARRDNLDIFVKAVADFQAIDGSVSLTSLLAWLQAEDELGNGLDAATPSEADSVKLLTVHRAKGLEWDVVFLVGTCRDKFPHTRSRGLWPRRLEMLPTPLRGDERDLPQLLGHDAEALKRLETDTKAHEATEELRLGYVAFTRARHRLVVSSYVWTEGRKGGLGPSPYQVVVRDFLALADVAPLAWRECPDKSEVNPLLQAEVPEHPWPVTEHTAEALRRLEAAELVAEATEQLAAGRGGEWDQQADLVERSVLDTWDDELERLLVEARRDRSPEVEVPLPGSISVTALSRLRDDPETFARELVRPMPRPPSPAARFGTRFHAWVEARFGQQPLLDPDELPGRGDEGIDDAADLEELVRRFEEGPFADRVPYAVEAPFALVLAGQVVRGRIDAVFRESDGSFLLVDWKTNRRADADPLQLALYRTAWAELEGLAPDEVRAGFYYVRTGELVEPADLPGRDQLETLLAGS